MAKFLDRDSILGKLKQIIPIITSSGASDGGKIAQTDASGRWDASLMPVGFGDSVKSIEASEALSAGDFVNIWNDGGSEKVRKADATSPGKEAHGYVVDAFSSGQSALVYRDGANTALSGLTPGARYYLSTTAGGATTTPVSASGAIHQMVGVAATASELEFEPEDVVVLA